MASASTSSTPAADCSSAATRAAPGGGLPANGPGKAGPDSQFRPHVVRPSTIKADRLYVANDATGLFRSDDAGKTLTRIDSVTRPDALAVGPASGGREAIYVRERAGTQEGVFQSLDIGKSWQHLSADDNEFALTHVLAAEPARPNRLFIGTSARGVFNGKPSQDRP